MRKIPTIFIRDSKPKCTPVTEEINPECQWVFDGEGIATRKIDGVNVKIVRDNLDEGSQEAYIRIKPNTRDYVEAEYEPLLCGMSWKDKYIAAAVNSNEQWNDGIYEAYGEGIRGNPEKVEGYHMVRISPVDMSLAIIDVPRSYRGLMGYLATHDIEGIVFHHRDGRMGKIKTKDFYHLSRP